MYVYLFVDGGTDRISGGYNVPLEANPFTSNLRILDCGDVPVTSYASPFQFIL